MRAGRLLIQAGLIIVIVLFVTPVSRQALMYAYEDAMLYIDPDAARAFRYAESHFSPSAPRAYDSDRAYELFLKTTTLDALYPMAYHHLARTEFVSNRPRMALRAIEKHIELHPDTPPSAYYIRGLSRASLKMYAEAAEDFELYITRDPSNWAAYNDLSWVHLMNDNPAESLAAVERILPDYPDNAWLLISQTSALFALGRIEEARDAGVRARDAVTKLTEADWMRVNPGNDPSWAKKGLETLATVSAQNLERIDRALKNK